MLPLRATASLMELGATDTMRPAPLAIAVASATS
jgi:hypothetical protein